MDARNETREFLMSRRANLTPDQAGLPVSGHRRVAGLRRAEVAMLADVSPEYYAKIERGQLAGVSDAVLESIARALQLDDAEREHLFDLARTANGAAQPVRRRRPRKWAPRDSLTRALDAIALGPAFVRNGRMDVLATNALGRAFYDEVFDGPGQGNLARHCFLDERATAFYPGWEAAADVTVSILRTEAGRDPRDKQLHDLIGELSTCSDAFRTRWGAHNVRRHGSGTKEFHHHEVGDLTLTYEGDGADRRAGPVLPHLHRGTRLTEPGAPAIAGEPRRDVRHRRTPARVPDHAREEMTTHTRTFGQGLEVPGPRRAPRLAG